MPKTDAPDLAAAIRRGAFEQLRHYTLTRGAKDPLFRHQYVVDAFAAQHPEGGAQLAGALVGLYLNVERGFDGRRVARLLRRLGKTLRRWPSWKPMAAAAAPGPAAVLAAPAGPVRDRAIDAWCAAVWAGYAARREDVSALLAPLGLDGP